MKIPNPLSHAYLITGGSPDSRAAFAREMAAAYLCEGERPPCSACRHCRKVKARIHPDITVIERELNKEGKLRSALVVDQIRRTEADAAILPNEAERKVYVIREAELLNTESQNAFLKLLEEPPEWVLFLLCAKNAAALLPTIRSRCASLHVGGEEAGDSAMAERAEAFIRALGDDVALLRCCAALEKLEAAEVRSFVSEARLAAARLLPPGKKLLDVEEELGRAAEYLKQNVSVKHVLGMLSSYEMRE